MEQVKGIYVTRYLNPRNLLFIIFSIIVFIIFYAPLSDLWVLSSDDELYSHIFGIPLISAYFLFLWFPYPVSLWNGQSLSCKLARRRRLMGSLSLPEYQYCGTDLFFICRVSPLRLHSSVVGYVQVLHC